MKITTHIAMAIKNIGEAGSDIAVFEGNFPEVIRQLAIWIGPRSMAKRFDLVICRNKDEAMAAMKAKVGRAIGSSDVMESLLGSLTDLLEAGEGEE